MSFLFKFVSISSLSISFPVAQGWAPCHGPSTQRSTLCGRGAQGTPAQPESTGPSTSWCLSPSSTWLSTSPTMVSFLGCFYGDEVEKLSWFLIFLFNQIEVMQFQSYLTLRSETITTSAISPHLLLSNSMQPPQQILSIMHSP